ncbi:MAG: IS21 family transposase [Hyphomonas sp.]
MKEVELYAKIRRAVLVEGKSRREAAAFYGVHRNTVSKMLQYPEPPGYRRREQPVSEKPGPFTAIVDRILAGEMTAPRKQRHTCKRIFERLRDEHGYSGGQTILSDYVRGARLRSQEVFVPLSHKPGHAQADFGEADAIIAGKRVRVHYFCMHLPHSDACFVKAYPAEVAEAFCDGHVSAFAFFGGVPLSILYDNTKLAVAQILGDGTRRRSRMFAGLQSHYLFADRFGRLGRGNDKGKVEGLVGYCRRNFMVPLPVAESFEALNAMLAESCRKRWQAVLRGYDTSIAERFKADAAVLMAQPAHAFEACQIVAGRVSSTSLVRYRTNDYSVPTAFAHQPVTIRAYVDHIDICCTGERIARHARCWGREDFIYDPLHYLALIEQKAASFDQAAPLDTWLLSPPVHRMRALMEASSGKAGRREFIQVLRLCETFDQSLVEASVAHALDIGAISFDAVKMIALAKLEHRPPRLDLSLYPYLPRANVRTTDARHYLELLAMETAA